jgi:uncharacterized Zn finger protein (UPF0148 family)
MDSEKSLVKITTKYHCMVSGKNQMEPCEGCSNPKGCLSKAMQYKENEEMDELNEKAVVKIDADGDVVKCAKGLGAGECGYKAGAKVCGACGAMAVMQKEDEASEEVEEKADMKPKKPMMDDDMDDAEDDAEDMAEDAMEAETGMDDDAMEEDEEDMKKGWMMKPDKNSRRRAIMGMGKKSGEFDDSTYICQLERKAYPGSQDICENCPGGCQSESGMPGLVEVEGMALDILGGKVLDSGYSYDADLFVVQAKADNGNTYELIADGQTGELLNLQRIKNPESGIEEKSAELGFSNQTGIIDATEAVEIALKSLEAEFGTTGDVTATDSDIFLGHDVYAVEIDAIDGKSYDVYVTLDGQFVGLDEWSADEVEEIEAEAAEIALKRAYSEESRMEMAKRGMALPDGSYPIKDVADLRNAIQAYGRAKDKEAAKAHIIKRAMALGAEDMIPENWVPKEVQDKYKKDEEKSEDNAFLASLMEFELLAQEESLKDIL